jgi:signal transduction histidine kinase
MQHTPAKSLKCFLFSRQPPDSTGTHLAHGINVLSASAGFSPLHDQSSDGKRDAVRARTPAAPEHRTTSSIPLITQRLLTRKLFPGTRRRFLLRLARSWPQFQKIQSAWRGLLTELDLPPDAERALCSLEVEKLYEFLRSGNWHAFEFALERLGQDLAGGKVPEEYAVAALGLFFEVCLCGLLGENPEDKEYALGLARLGSVSHLFLIAGYANHRAAGMRILEEKLQKTEDRAGELAISVSEANEKERRRLASDLHDEIGHDLVVLKLYLEMIAADIKTNLDSEVRKRLAEAIGLATRAIEAVRRLAFDLGPGIFDDSGFVRAMRNYARRFTATTGVKARVRVSLAEARLEDRDELALYRVLQGALSNVLKHARAKAVVIMVKRDGNSVFMSVEDDGKGFHVARKLRDSSASFGLQAMRERIELLGGSLQIQSPALQAGRRRYGTKIEVRLPLTRVAAK